MGRRCSLKELAEYRWVTCVSRFVGRLIMLIASNGHFLGQIPHPMHSRSLMKAILLLGSTSIHSFWMKLGQALYSGKSEDHRCCCCCYRPVVQIASSDCVGQRQGGSKQQLTNLLSNVLTFPVLTTGHDLRHSCLHFLGLHLQYRSAYVWNTARGRRIGLVAIDDGDTGQLVLRHCCGIADRRL